MTTSPRDYREYISSDAWKETRTEALRRSIRRDTWRSGPTCEVCGKRGARHKKSRSDLDYSERRYRIDDSNGLQVHHLHYRNLGHEKPEDLIVLCTDELHFDAYDRAVAAFMNVPPHKRHEIKWPEIPNRVGCHERAHDDRGFRLEVARIAAERRLAT